MEKLDWENRKGYVREVNVDYYTDANMLTSLRVLDVFRDGERAGISRFSGEVLVSEITTLFKKFKLDTHENVGWGKVHLPQQDMHTTAYWLTLPAKVREKYTVPQIEKALGGIANLLRNIAPVSYTQLDVYKRQVVCRWAPTGGPFCCSPAVSTAR